MTPNELATEIETYATEPNGLPGYRRLFPLPEAEARLLAAALRLAELEHTRWCEEEFGAGESVTTAVELPKARSAYAAARGER